MSFIPDNLDQQAASLDASPAAASITAGLMNQQLSAQQLAPRSFSDPSYLMEINEIRAKVNAGTATKDDLKRAIALIRETRGAVSSAPASAKSKTASPRTSKTKPAKPDGQALLDLL